MFPTGLTITLVIVKVLRMAKDGPHIHILLSPIYKNQSPYAERRRILSSKGSCNTTSNIALVNLFLTGLISFFYDSETTGDEKRWSSHPHSSISHTEEPRPLYRTSSYPDKRQELPRFSSEPVLAPKSSFTSYPLPGGRSQQSSSNHSTEPIGQPSRVISRRSFQPPK